MEDRELLLKSDPEFERLAFTVLAIEASAQKNGYIAVWNEKAIG